MARASTITETVGASPKKPVLNGSVNVRPPPPPEGPEAEMTNGLPQGEETGFSGS